MKTTSSERAGFLRRVERVAARLPRGVLLALIPVVILVLGLIDYATGFELQFFIFYMLPVSFYAYFVGAGSAVVVSILSAFSFLAADLLGGHTYSHPLIPVWNMLIRLVTFLFVTMLLHRLQSELRRETELSRTDALTGLLNRRGFEEAAARMLGLASRSGMPLALVYMDLDGFKKVNDLRGHDEGDEVLRAVGGILRAQLRAADLVARLGGDEFVVLLPETGPESALAVSSKLREALARRALDRGWPVTLSAGIASHSGPGDSIAELIARGDAVMYRAKQAGRDRTAREIEESLTPRDLG